MTKIKNEDLGRLTVNEFKTAQKNRIILVLDNVRSLNNVGSVVRTADSFLLESIYLCGITGTPPHRDINKTALGATDSVNWKHYPTTVDAINELKTEGYKVSAVEQTEHAIMLDKYIPSKDQNIALVFGSEVGGVNDDVITLCDNCIEIPQQGTKHSLNIAVSVGIVVWDFISKLR